MRRSYEYIECVEEKGRVDLPFSLLPIIFTHMDRKRAYLM